MIAQRKVDGRLIYAEPWREEERLALAEIEFLALQSRGWLKSFVEDCMAGVLGTSGMLQSPLH